VIGEPAVTGIEDARYAGQFRSGIERPRPPDLRCEIQDGFRAAINFAVGCGDAHFAQQILGRQGEKGLHARILQCSEAEAPCFKSVAESPGERGADGAITVEEDPAAGCVLSFTISHF